MLNSQAPGPRSWCAGATSVPLALNRSPTQVPMVDVVQLRPEADCTWMVHGSAVEPWQSPLSKASKVNDLPAVLGSTCIRLKVAELPLAFA